jgi:hypothetical protein
MVGLTPRPGTFCVERLPGTCNYTPLFFRKFSNGGVAYSSTGTRQQYYFLFWIITHRSITSENYVNSDRFSQILAFLVT